MCWVLDKCSANLSVNLYVCYGPMMFRVSRPWFDLGPYEQLSDDLSLNTN